MKRYVAILLCLCLLLCSGCGLLGDKPMPQSSAEPAPQPAETPSPSPEPTDRGGEVVTTAAPGSTPSPISTPVPSAAIPESAGEFDPVDISGSFRSDTGTALNLRADWECVSVSAKNVRLTITLSLESYSLSVGERGANQLILNGIPITYRTSALEVPSGGLSKTELYTWSETFPLMEDGSFQQDLYAFWVFSGTYSGVQIDQLELSGHIAVP